MLKGNKGEWSELYVFFKLLADGKLFSADQNLARTEEFVEIRSAFRKENIGTYRYDVRSEGNINIIDVSGENADYSIPISEATRIASKLLVRIQDGKGTSSGEVELENELSQWKVHKVSQDAANKGDINLLVYDPTHGVQSRQEYSIKSFLGSDPTLFNANPTTNIIYSITDSNGHPISEEHLNMVNDITTGHKYIRRVCMLEELGYTVKYHGYQGETFKLNLQMIDSDLPEIMAFIVKKKYTARITWITEVIECLNAENPMGYNLKSHDFYEYRIINFLIESALGMTSAFPWSGIHQVVGGLIVVKQDSEILCYHVIDFNKFKSYLMRSARLDNPSGSKMGYGHVYRQDGQSFIKLNFQVKS
ncbi:MAG: HpaII family restriction endonuclease [Flavobacteriales bacterium]|nr:HpaII family restriction endonuclease [Flavobacteriales bacterium]